MKDLLESQNKAKEEARIKNEAVEAAAKGVLGTSVTQAMQNAAAASKKEEKEHLKEGERQELTKRIKEKQTNLNKIKNKKCIYR